MADLEKVIKGLECVICPNKFCGDCSYFIRNENDSDTGWCNRDAIYKDALALLKAQEPRVMTLEEVLAHDYKDGPLWLETFDNVITCGFAYCYKYYVQFSIPVMENEYLLKRDTWNRTDTYIKIWRCWTSRPTDEQREATPWGGGT